MARARKTRRRRPAHFRQFGRNLALEAGALWIIVAVIWAYTGWALYSNVVRKVHVHINVALLLADFALPPLAVWMTIEWRRSRRG